MSSSHPSYPSFLFHGYLFHLFRVPFSHPMSSPYPAFPPQPSLNFFPLLSSSPSFVPFSFPLSRLSVPSISLVCVLHLTLSVIGLSSLPYSAPHTLSLATPKGPISESWYIHETCLERITSLLSFILKLWSLVFLFAPTILYLIKQIMLFLSSLFTCANALINL